MKKLMLALLCAALLCLVWSGASEGDPIGFDQYQLTLIDNYNGGAYQVIPFVSSYTLPERLRTDAEFLGWSERPDDALTYQAHTKITLTKDLTLYAIWSDTAVIPY